VRFGSHLSRFLESKHRLLYLPECLSVAVPLIVISFDRKKPGTIEANTLEEFGDEAHESLVVDWSIQSDVAEVTGTTINT
jgi:hypothetical protein